jgi:hypothetical protein
MTSFTIKETKDIYFDTFNVKYPFLSISRYSKHNNSRCPIEGSNGAAPISIFSSLRARILRARSPETAPPLPPPPPPPGCTDADAGTDNASDRGEKTLALLLPTTAIHALMHKFKNYIPNVIIIFVLTVT